MIHNMIHLQKLRSAQPYTWNHMEWHLEGSKLSEPQLSINDNGLVTGPVQEFWWLEKQVKTYKLTQLRGCHVCCMLLPNLRYYLLVSDIIWYHWNQCSFRHKTFQDPQDCVGYTATYTSLTIQPDAAEMCADSTSSMWKTRPPIATFPLGQNLDDSSRQFMIQTCETIQYYSCWETSPWCKGSEFTGCFRGSLFLPLVSKALAQRRQQWKRCGEEGPLFWDAQDRWPFEKQMEKRTGLIKSERIWLWFILMDLFLSIWRHFSPICPQGQEKIASPSQGAGTNFRCKPVQESHEIS